MQTLFTSPEGNLQHSSAAKPNPSNRKQHVTLRRIHSEVYFSRTSVAAFFFSLLQIRSPWFMLFCFREIICLGTMILFLSIAWWIGLGTALMICQFGGSEGVLYHKTFCPHHPRSYSRWGLFSKAPYRATVPSVSESHSSPPHQPRPTCLPSHSCSRQ